MTRDKVLGCLAALTLLGGFFLAQAPGQDKAGDDKAGKPAADTSSTQKLEKKPFRIEIVLKGILEAEETAEISFRPQIMVQQAASHGALTIRKIAEHGARVKQGDLLVTFDSTKINEVIEDLERERKVLEASIKVAEEELPLFEKSAPVETAHAEAAKKHADDDLKYYFETARPQLLKEMEMSVKSAKFYLEYAEEELRQLEKMYKANDLTEETERMILRRQRNAVERAGFWYQTALLERDYMLKISLPAKDRSYKEHQIRQDQNLERARTTLGPLAIQKQTALAKMRFDRDKAAVRLEKLLKDRAGMSITSPIDGIVYHGKFAKGNWSIAEAADSKLVPNGTVSPDEVFLTVVKPRPVVVHLAVEEKDVHLLKPGEKGTARVVFHPDRKLPARVAKLGAVPAAAGKFEAVAVLTVGPADADLMPGMACSVKFVPYSKKDALTVPSKSIHDEDDKYVVDVVGKGGKREKRDVTPGRTDGELTEILSGLVEGDVIYLERPGQRTSDGSTPAKKEKGTLP